MMIRRSSLVHFFVSDFIDKESFFPYLNRSEVPTNCHLAAVLRHAPRNSCTDSFKVDREKVRLYVSLLLSLDYLHLLITNFMVPVFVFVRNVDIIKISEFLK